MGAKKQEKKILNLVTYFYYSSEKRLKINNSVTAYCNYLLNYSSLDPRFSRVLTHLTSTEI